MPTSIKQCSMTIFGELFSSDHRGSYFDTPINSITKHRNDEIPPSFQRILKSSYPISVRVYNHYLEEKINKSKIQDTNKSLLNIVATRKLSACEEQSLNEIESRFTKIMIEAEIKTNKLNKNSPWSSEFHITIKTLSIWKLIKT